MLTYFLQFLAHAEQFQSGLWRKIIFAGMLSSLFLGCASVEFIPDKEYANRRRDQIDSFRFFSRKPDMPVDSLGKLVFRNLYGRPDSEDFQLEVQREGMARGANCGYVSKRSMHRQTQFRTAAVDQTNRHGGQTGEIASDVETVEVILFQCKDDDSNKDRNKH